MYPYTERIKANRDQNLTGSVTFQNSRNFQLPLHKDSRIYARFRDKEANSLTYNLWSRVPHE